MLGAHLPRQAGHLLLERQSRICWYGDSEPDVELAGPLVVVADARIPIELRGRGLELIGWHLERDQHRVVAELACIEDRGDLPNDGRFSSVQPLHAREHVVLADADTHPKLGERSSHEREVPLDLVEDAGVDVVARKPKSCLGFADGRFGSHAGQSNAGARLRLRG